MDAVQKMVRSVIEMFGTRLCGDASRCDSILRDYLGNDQLRINLLMTALREQIPEELQKPQGGIPESVLLSRLQRKLHDHAGIGADHALWAIQTWRYAVAGATPEGKPFLLRCPSCAKTHQGNGIALGAVVTCPACAARVRVSTDGSQFDEEPLPLVEEIERARFKATVDLNGHGEFSTITAAVAAAPAGAEIRILPGVYRESLTLRQDVDLIGLGEVGTVVIAPTDKPCLDIKAGMVLVRGLSLGGEASARALPCPATRISGGQMTLEDCILVAKTGEALDVTGNLTRVSVSHCAFSSPKRSSLTVRNHANVTVEDSVFSESGSSSIVCDASNLSICGCKVTKGKYAGVVATGSALTLKNTVIAEHVDAGVTVKRSQFHIQNCQISRNLGRGIWASQSSSGEISDCDLTGNGHGSLFIDDTCEVNKTSNLTDR